jgi:hypothetical protein
MFGLTGVFGGMPKRISGSFCIAVILLMLLVGCKEGPEIPADHATTGCAECHLRGVNEASPWPDGHTEYTEAQCTECHSPAE